MIFNALNMTKVLKIGPISVTIGLNHAEILIFCFGIELKYCIFMIFFSVKIKV